MSDQPEWQKPHGQGWTTASNAVQHDNPWFAVDVYKATAPTGAPADYFLLDFKNVAVGVLALYDDATVVLVGQWRFPFGTYSWEMPEGGAPKSEAPLDGIKRELREEAGLEAADWRLVLTMQLSNSSSNEVAHCYLATGLTPVPRDLDPTEALVVERVPFGEALAAAVEGRIQDSMTVATLLRVHHMAVTGELPAPLAAGVLGRKPLGAL
jgi:8-oxo-dGTP pyrophosphatase MutT (NUDIX family)